MSDLDPEMLVGRRVEVHNCGAGRVVAFHRRPPLLVMRHSKHTIIFDEGTKQKIVLRRRKLLRQVGVPFRILGFENDDHERTSCESFRTKDGALGFVASGSTPKLNENSPVHISSKARRKLSHQFQNENEQCDSICSSVPQSRKVKSRLKERIFEKESEGGIREGAPFFEQTNRGQSVDPSREVSEERFYFLRDLTAQFLNKGMGNQSNGRSGGVNI